VGGGEQARDEGTAEVPPTRAVQRPGARGLAALLRGPAASWRVVRGRRVLQGSRMRPEAMGTTVPCTVADDAVPPDAVTVQVSTDGRPIFSPCRTT
jgi:hypothetical protein